MEWQTVNAHDADWTRWLSGHLLLEDGSYLLLEDGGLVEVLYERVLDLSWPPYPSEGVWWKHPVIEAGVLLLEGGSGYLLLETGDHIIVDINAVGELVWSHQPVSRTIWS